MELDQTKLLLIANVVAITVVTALALMWYLRKRDEQKSIAGFNWGPQTDLHRPEAPAAPPPAAVATPVQIVNVREEPVAYLRCTPPVTLPERDQEIRQSVSVRAQGWSAPSVTQWHKRPDSGESPGLWRIFGGDPVELPLPQSQEVILPSHQPSPATVQLLAAPLQLCRSATAARFGNLFQMSEGSSPATVR
jgi:hypothetical protein